MIIIPVSENQNDAEIFNAEILHAFTSCLASIFLAIHMSNK